MKHYVGIDLGGTNIKAGVINEAGEIISRASIKTRTSGGQMDIVLDMGRLASQVTEEAGLKQSDICAIGVGSPGTPDNITGTLIYANNLPFLHVPIRSGIRQIFDKPVYVDNDANVAALAESVAGAAQGTSHSVTITLGTGVGGGVVINRRIYSGFNNAGCEIGHIVIKSGGESCTCGRCGCFEVYASATGLIRETEKAALSHPDSLLNILIKQNEGKADGQTAFIGMRQGDPVAADVVAFYIEMLAEGLANVINGYMPEVIAIGGGISNEGDALLEPVREKAIARSYLGEGVAKPRIVLARMGNQAGIVGAAMMAANCLEDGLPG